MVTKAGGWPPPTSRNDGRGLRSGLLLLIVSFVSTLLVGCGGEVPATSGPTDSTVSQTVPTAMFRADCGRTGVYKDGGPSGPVELAWRFETGGEIASSPTVSDAVVYFGSKDGNLYALDAKTGVEKWRFETAGEVQSSPAVAEGIVYFGSDDGSLYAVEAASGALKWRLPTLDKVVCSPVVHEGVVFFGSLDGTLYALDAETGLTLWAYTGGPTCSPAVVDGVVYCHFYGGLLRAIDASTGQEKWRLQPEPETTMTSMSVAVCDGVVYCGDTYGEVYAVDAETGKLRWILETSGQVFTSPAVSNETLYFTEHGWLHAVDVKTGEEKWDFQTKDRFLSWSSPAVSGNVLYFGHNDGRMYAVGIDDGQQKWEFETGGPVYSSPVVADGIVYFGSADGNLYALAAASPAEGASDAKQPSEPAAAETKAEVGTIADASLIAKIYREWSPDDIFLPSSLPEGVRLADPIEVPKTTGYWSAGGEAGANPLMDKRDPMAEWQAMAYYVNYLAPDNHLLQLCAWKSTRGGSGGFWRFLEEGTDQSYSIEHSLWYTGDIAVDDGSQTILLAEVSARSSECDSIYLQVSEFARIGTSPDFESCDLTEAAHALAAAVARVEGIGTRAGESSGNDEKEAITNAVREGLSIDPDWRVDVLYRVSGDWAGVNLSAWQPDVTPAQGIPLLLQNVGGQWKMVVAGGDLGTQDWVERGAPEEIATYLSPRR